MQSLQVVYGSVSYADTVPAIKQDDTIQLLNLFVSCRRDAENYLHYDFLKVGKDSGHG